MQVNAGENWHSMPERGWTDTFILPTLTDAVRESFDRLMPDIYAPQAKRLRRFSQFIAFFNYKNELTLRRLEPRPFVQKREFNSLSGGIKRNFEPLESECNIAPYIEQLFDRLKIDRSRKYHLDVHQYRVVGEPGAEGDPVPEGAHRDGMECVAILVIERKGITSKSAEFSLLDPKTRKPLVTTVVQAGEGIVLDDEKLLHDASPIVASGSEAGYRDYFVVNINRWEHARYGREHERAAANPEDATPSDPWKVVKIHKTADEINRRFEYMKRLLAEGRIYDTVPIIDELERKAKKWGTENLSFSQTDLVKAKKSIAAVMAKHHKRFAHMVVNDVAPNDWAAFTDVETPQDGLNDVLAYHGIDISDMRERVLGLQSYGRATLVLTVGASGIDDLNASIVETSFNDAQAKLNARGIMLAEIPSKDGRRTVINSELIAA
jgi:hypothetical protein